jgi:hypothetical protein
MKKLIYYSLIVCFAAFVSCKTEPITTVLEDTSDETRVEEAQELTNSPFTFIEVAIEGDTLIAIVQYPGGCGNQPIKINHLSGLDPCRAIIRQELKFNVSDFRGTPDGTTVLLLEKWTQPIIYSY